MGLRDVDKKTLSVAEKLVYEKYFEADTSDIVKKYDNFFYEFRQWAYWYPDKFLEMFASDNFELDPDQKLTLRLFVRGQYTKFVQSRGTGKSFIAYLGMVVKALILPNYEVIFVAQTREASARTLSSKYNETMRMMPFLENEISGNGPNRDSKEMFNLEFKNGSIIRNGIAGEGQRGDRAVDVVIDEQMFVSTKIINNVIIPIISEPRKSLKDGKQGIHEFNCIKGISSAGYYGSPAHSDYIKSYEISANDGDNFTICSDYSLPLMYKRAFDKPDVDKMRKTSSKLEFDMNILSNFGGSGEGGLVSINDIELCRTLEKPEFRADGKHEYIFAYDVARNWNTGKTDDSALIIGKLFRSPNGDVGKIAIVNIVTISANEKFERQSLIIKKMDELFNPSVIIQDAQVIGVGLCEKLMEETDGGDKIYPAYNTINTPETPDTDNYITKLYALQSSRVETKQSDIIKCAIDAFDKRKVELLVPPSRSVVSSRNKDDFVKEELPLYETMAMIEEILNLDTKYNEKSDSLSISQRTKGINKDKIMATMYLIFYALEKMNVKKDKQLDTSKYLSMFN
jgi:hypothetical protein